MLHQQVPAAPLSAFVALLWTSERGTLPHARERKLPTGCVDIVIPLLQPAITRFADEADAVGQVFRGGVVQGAHDQAVVRGTGGPSCAVGVHFRPGGAAALLGGALADLRNRTVALDGLWGTDADDLRDWLRHAPDAPERLRRLEAFLVRRLRPGAAPDPLVADALARFQQHPALATVSPVQRASGLSPQAFTARFERAVGLTPKRFARVQRFHSLVRRLAAGPPADWAEAALDAGYADQPHLIRDFGRLAGITPVAYCPVSAEQPEHVALEKRPIQPRPAALR